jgi:hypothetical protein
MKSSFFGLVLGCMCLLAGHGNAQINSGSDGHDGAFNPTQSVEIDMADHPDGIYHYTTVNVPSGVTVTFKPNAKNTPVVWLVQGDCVILGKIDISGKEAIGGIGGAGGPGGWWGGNGGNPASSGMGPGAGGSGVNDSNGIYFGGNGSFGTLGTVVSQQKPAGATYGNKYLIPLIGGSGGGGSAGFVSGGGGGGGGVLIACSGSVALNGIIATTGGCGADGGSGRFGNGSGGAVRILAATFSGSGAVQANGASYSAYPWRADNSAGYGRVRLDVLENHFGGSISGNSTIGFQPIIIPAANQGVQLSISTIGGVQVAASPGGVLVNPDVIIPAQLTNPMNVVVNCSNLPLNTDITLKVRPANGTEVVAVGKNTAGTQTASTATIPVSMPRGGGIIFASAVTGLAPAAAATGAKEERMKNLAQTGLTTDGETFVAMEVTAALGGKQQVCYLTESGKRFRMPVN